jgi:hypothetical protein
MNWGSFCQFLGKIIMVVQIFVITFNFEGLEFCNRLEKISEISLKNPGILQNQENLKNLNSHDWTP